MRPDRQVEQALERHAAGARATEIARELGIPRRTVAGWIAGTACNGCGVLQRTHRRSPARRTRTCSACISATATWCEARRDVYRLCIACDAVYPHIIAAAADAIRAVLPQNKVRLIRHPVHRCTRVYCSSKLFPMLLPQHGPGRKHTRPIVLTEWQARITADHARELVRGLLHSDGCRYIARQRVGPKTYEYARYSFTNRSEDIKRIFCTHLDLLGIRWSRPNDRQIAVARRSEVAKLDAFVGPKR